MTRIKRGLDVVQTNVMVADTDLNVVYVNDSIKVMLQTAEADIRKDVPSFNAAKVVGTNIDTFHKQPSYQRGMLAKMVDTHKAKLVLGGRTFSLILNPINDDAGARLGYVVEWRDMTAELAQQAAEAERQTVERKRADENLRIKMALDSVTTNVMIADNDRNIVYMNGSVKEMLTTAESDIRKALPNFDVRKLDGAKIDVFHKHPEHQARMLATFRDTHRTQIVVGGRTFSLIAAPIINADGERLGAVVEWKDRTAEVAVENEVGSIVTAATRGDFTQRINLNGKEGFFRGLGESLNQLLETSSVGLNEVVRVLSALAKGDLTETIDNEYHGTFGQLKDDSNATVAQLTEIITQIKTATDTINVAAGEIAAGNLDLSQRTEEQAASLEETASSMEELTSTVKQNAENARQANQLALGASDVAIKGGQVVGQVVTTMSAINDSSKKIVDIISVIDGIAFQTNILALNAAVEAARAGEQGRGFAVVAAEVRSLAQRSASAAKEIKTLIGDSVEKVGNGTKLVEQAGKTMEEIVTSVKRVTDIMAEISAASQEQSSGIDQINKAITQMDQVTQQNAALVEEASAAARSMEDQANNLSTSVATFRLAGGASAPGQELRRPASAGRPAAPQAGRGAKPAPAPMRRPAAAGSAPSKASRAAGGDTWTEF
jgi:methyl-accepting chemotaxis protein